MTFILFFRMLHFFRVSRILARKRSDYIVAIRNADGDLERAILPETESRTRNPKITVEST